MNNKKTSSWNLGVKGYIVVILAFFSCYVYSALTSDSLNVTRDIFVNVLKLNQGAIYAMSTIAVPFGIVGSIILGRLINKHSIRLYWGLSSNRSDAQHSRCCCMLCSNLHILPCICYAACR